MRRALPLVLLLPALAGCGVALPEPAPPAAVTRQIVEGEDRTIEELLVDVPVSKASAGLPELTRLDLEEVLREAREANPDERIANVHLMNVFHSSDVLVRVAFEPYETGDRIRRYHTVFLLAAEQPGDPDPGVPANHWQLRDAASPLEGNRELCPPWRSFTGGLPPLAAETVHLWFAPELPAADLLAVVDCVRDQIPDGERIEGIESGSDCWFMTSEEQDALRARGVEVYELRTIDGCSGSLFKVEHEGERWTAENIGKWIS